MVVRETGAQRRVPRLRNAHLTAATIAFIRRRRARVALVVLGLEEEEKLWPTYLVTQQVVL